ncbi:unnamed protein product [Ostreobium quekettii]|uniref:DUF676 domain-containing protein n=1 Tax=Ostreobium quekettii TaxID=121088 RepID=A0A8S1IRH4_9CHLO|nr:unnamed protein product [Ostreobium quekettii]|eukprot:evm.model.scf_1738.3 EVM.evm.TU.scf_1738.3   scf_1738:22321-23893(+)
MPGLLLSAREFLHVLRLIIKEQGGFPAGIPGAVTGVLGPREAKKPTDGQTGTRAPGTSDAEPGPEEPFLQEPGPKEPFLHVLADIWGTYMPTIPTKTPSWLKKRLPTLAWMLYGEDSVVYPADWSTRWSNDSEAWFFLNGIATTLASAKKNATRMGAMFGREITVVHNPTDSGLVDLLECCIGKLWDNWSTDPREVAAEQLKSALLEEGKRKVVLICHSQGTIIASNVLRDLHEDNDLTDRHLAKLEVYAFANCAHQMEKGDIGHLETLSNTLDTVAMLGSCCPYPEWQDVDGETINIEGDKFFEEGKRGHMLNKHYLQGLEQGQYAGSKLHDYRREAKSTAV